MCLLGGGNEGIQEALVLYSVGLIPKEPGSEQQLVLLRETEMWQEG